MMQTALRTRLKNDATVASLVGTRIDWNARPQGKSLPAITLQTIHDGRPQKMSGFQVTRQTLVQVDCWGEKYADARNAAEAVIACLVPAADESGVRFLRSFVDRGMDTLEDTDNGQVHRVSIDLRVTHTIP